MGGSRESMWMVHLLMAGWCLVSAVFAQSSRPNIVLLVADDLGYGELGCQGNPQIPTPHIDSLAAHGIRFTSGYVTASVCSPSRAGLLTGRYQTRFGYEMNVTGARNEEPGLGLPAAETTLAEYLQEAGYTTALVGKWHLGATAPYHPLRQGFDEFFGFLHEGHYYVPPPYPGVTTMLRRRSLPDGSQGRWIDGNIIYSTHMGRNEPAYDANNAIFRGGQPVEESAYLTDAWTREAVGFIQRNRDKPFFLYLAYNAVHSPLQGADSYMRRFEAMEDIHRRIFAAMLANLDDSVGEVLEALRATGVEQNTLIFFLSDNGGPTRELTSSNRPLRGGKGDVYEGGIRVPFLVQWKARLPQGQVYPHPVSALDIFATVASLVKAPVDHRRPLDGVNLIPFLTGIDQGRPHEVLFWRMNQRRAIRVGDWKLLRNQRGDLDAGWSLYNLAEDMAESDDLASRLPARLAELQKYWDQWNDEMIEPLWRPGRD